LEVKKKKEKKKHPLVMKVPQVVRVHGPVVPQCVDRDFGGEGDSRL